MANINKIDLDIDEKEFIKLNTNMKITILYGNLKEVKNMIRMQNGIIQKAELDRKFNMKINYAWLSALTAGIGTLLSIKFI